MFEKVEFPSGGVSMEDHARAALLGLLVGEVAPVKPLIQKLLVSLACSDSPSRSPKAGQPYSQLALGASLVDRVAAVLQLKTLDETDLLDMLEALRLESEEPPPLTVLRPFFAHKSCTDRVRIRLVLKYTKRSTPKSSPAVWRFLTEHGGPYARAAAMVSLMTSSPTTTFGAQERLSWELGDLGDEGFETFKTLIADRSEGASGNNAIGLADFTELLLSARNLCE